MYLFMLNPRLCSVFLSDEYFSRYCHLNSIFLYKFNTVPLQSAISCAARAHNRRVIWGQRIRLYLPSGYENLQS